MGNNKHSFSASIISILIISVIFFMGIGTCIICNLAINKEMSWSLYVIGGTIIAWVTIISFIYFKRHRFIISMTAISLSVIPYLFLIEYLVTTKDWVIPLALPVTVVALAYMWIVGALFVYSNTNRWYLVSIAFLLSIVLNFAIGFIVAEFNNEKNISISSLIVSGSLLIVAIVMFIIGAIDNRDTFYNKPTKLAE